MKKKECLVIFQFFILTTMGDHCFHNNRIPISNVRPQDAQQVSERIDCHPDKDASSSRCGARGCTWEPTETEGAPWCYYPYGYGYQMEEEPTETEDGYIVRLRRLVAQSMFGEESEEIWVQIFMQTDARLRILVTDNNPYRFRVPIDIPNAGPKPANPEYIVSFTADPSFGIRVNRRSTGELVFDTSLPGLVYSNQFIQLPLRFPNGSTLYGWGENEQYSLAHDWTWNTFGLYGRDQPPAGPYTNMYGVHPRLTLLDKNGDASGILFLNSAAQELSVTPMPGAIYRTIGGVLDVYVFLGPEPEQVVEQYTEAVGRTPLPPYWSLGFHLCRYGYDRLENMQAARDRMVEYKIPQDAQWGDIDIMDKQLDFTVDPVNFAGLPSYVKDLKAEGIKFVTILDPCISTGEPNCTYKPFDLGNQFGVWINKPDGNPLVGRVWPNDPVYFPDYTNPRTHEWWTLLIKEFHDLLEFDGLWIDMNEPANFVAGDLNDGGCASNQLNYPPYIPHVALDDAAHGLSDKTICGDAVHSIGRHYDVHNMFGWTQSKPTLDAVRLATGKRGLVLSRSTFVGSGAWVAHWLGDNFSNWSNLKNSIIGMLQFNQFGIPFVGADICGFIGDTTPQLCARWQQLGAFYPFSRNHNALGNKEQDPGVFGDEVAKITREALITRYSLLPYLYTLFWRHTTQGGTVARPLWHEFPRDGATRGIDDQFLLGPALLVSPVLVEDAVSRSLYLPPDSAWYSVSNFSSWDSWKKEETLGWIDVEAPLDTIPLHIRGGEGLLLQYPGINTVESRKNPLALVLPLDQRKDCSGYAYYDDGDSLDSMETGQFMLFAFQFYDNNIEWVAQKDGWDGRDLLILQDIVVIGLDLDNVTSLTMEDGSQLTDFTYQDGKLMIRNLNLSTYPSWRISVN